MKYSLLTSYPTVSRSPTDILRLFEPGSEVAQKAARDALVTTGPVLGCDLEFDTSVRNAEVPTILGLSDGYLNISVPFADGLPFFKILVERHPDLIFVGHSFISADLFVFRNTGVKIGFEQVCDTIIWHWLTAMHLCKGTGKTEDEDGEKRGKGWMNLWAFSSIHTSLPNWKECVGDDCQALKLPCYDHNPFEYNGVDAFAPVDALPSVLRVARIRGVDKLYDLHRELVYVLAEMSRYGIQCDMPYIKTLKDDLEKDKTRIAAALPFSPTSPKQIVAYFKTKGIDLADAQEATIREAADDSDDPELHLLLESKELGNGPDRWFGPRFVDDYGVVHPRGGIFTSSGRLMFSSPNLQNVGHWRVDRWTCGCLHKKTVHIDGVCTKCDCKKFKELNIGGRVRRGVIARPSHYLAKFDLKNGEGQVMFNFAGYEVPEDAHTWTADLCKLTDDMDYCLREGGRRQGAKKIVHGESYLQGLQLKTSTEMKGQRIRQEIAAGARVVYPNWTFEGKTVSFTGANFAERVWGSKSWENRRKALEIIEGKYFANVPEMRKFQQRVTEACEKEKAVRTPLGYVTLSYGLADERCKTACAIWGSQPVGHITKIALIRAWRGHVAGRQMRPLLQEHDSILYEVADVVAPDQAARHMKEDADVHLPEIPTLKIPSETEYSPVVNGEPSNWRDMVHTPTS